VRVELHCKENDFRRDLYQVLFVINDVFCLITIPPSDPPFGIVTAVTHVAAIHSTCRAMSATSACTQHTIIPGFHGADAPAYLNHLSEHLVTYDQFILARGWFRPSTRCFLSVRSTDANFYNPEFDLIW
jgi:hypothetical protein